MALCYPKTPHCSHHIPQKTLTAERNQEMPRHESDGIPHPIMAGPESAVPVLAEAGGKGMRVQDMAQTVPAAPGTHTQGTGRSSSGT